MFKTKSIPGSQVIARRVTVAGIVLLLSTRANAQLLKGQTVSSEKRVTFTFKAPDAKEVKVISLTDSLALGAKEYTLEKNDNGIWSVTTGPCRPGFHYYDLSVDGFRCPDPESPMYFGWGKWISGLEIPDDDLSFYLPQDVPHGEIRYHWYLSSTTGTYRKCVVYTPPGYDGNTKKHYPVLYLQHGSGESELGWMMQGKVNFILDNLIAANKAKPMIIVMDNGYAARKGAGSPWRPGNEDNEFEKLMTKELIPEIDANFRTLANKQGRAIAGLSMGGGQALNIGLAHTGIFKAIGAFSGGARRFDTDTSYNGIFKDAAAFNTSGILLWIGCGQSDGGYANLKSFHEKLDAKGIRNTWYEVPGSHEWQVWRKHLYEFAQLLFK